MGSFVSHLTSPGINSKFPVERETYAVVPSNNFWIDKVDLFIYINLLERKDRRQLLIAELKKLGVPSHKVYRINATKWSPGYTGCTKSHLTAVNFAMMFNVKNVCIMEDDIQVNIDPSKIHTKTSSLLQEIEGNYDVLYLAMTPIRLQTTSTETDSAYRVLQALAMPAMIISRRYLPKLAAMYTEALKTSTPHDLITQKYQEHDNWFGFFPPLIIQRPGFSDIEKRQVDYRQLEVDGQMLRFVGK
jgi:hypothetical protein